MTVSAVTEIPKNVLRFERLMYVILAIGIAVTLLLNNPARDAVIAKSGLIPWLIVLAVVCGLWVLMIRVAGRGRSNAIRWLLVVFVLGGLVMAAYDAAIRHRTDMFTDICAIAETAASAVALGFLFTGDARDWYRKRPQVDSSVFD